MQANAIFGRILNGPGLFQPNESYIAQYEALYKSAANTGLTGRPPPRLGIVKATEALERRSVDGEG